VFERREATMLDNYYLIAGALWSVLHKGEKVIVLQDLPSGYYLVKATRKTMVKLSVSEVRRNISDSFLVGNTTTTTTTSGRFSEPTSPNNLSDTTPVVSIMVELSSNGNLVLSDSFQSSISDDSGIAESKRTSNFSIKDEEEDKGVSVSGDVHTENKNDKNGYETILKPQSNAVASSLSTNHHSRNDNGKLPTPSVNNLSNSQSFSNTSEHLGKDEVSLPLIGCVPPSLLDCYVDHLFSPTLVRPSSGSFTLQQPPSSKSPSISAKKRKSAKGNRLSLQVDSFLPEDNSLSTKHKSSTLPLNGSSAGSPVAKPEKERGRRALKSFFKKRLSQHGKMQLGTPEGEGDKELLSVHEESLPPDIERVQSPVYGMIYVVLISLYYYCHDNRLYPCYTWWTRV